MLPRRIGNLPSQAVPLSEPNDSVETAGDSLSPTKSHSPIPLNYDLSLFSSLLSIPLSLSLSLSVRVRVSFHLLARANFSDLDQINILSFPGNGVDPPYPCWQRACVGSVLRVMPLTSFTADAFGVLTICLVALLSLLGLLCIVYSVYFKSRVRDQGFAQLSYFSGPWIVRITFVFFAIWWGLGEIARLTWLRREGRVPGGHSLKWQEAVCKGYIVSSLGFAEPCLFLTMLFLLRAPLQRMESGILSRSWNGRTAGLVLLYCLPVFVLQLFLILIGPQLSKSEGLGRIPHYFTSATQKSNGAHLCTYPLTSTILHGIFATVLTLYLSWLGRRILKLVINKGLQRRVYALIFSVSGFFPLRIVLLGFSVMSKPEHFQFEALSFSAFLSLLCCAGVCICVLVYYPIADSLALVSSQDLEGRRVIGNVEGDQNDNVSLIANRSHVEGSVTISPERNSDASTKRGSISFRTFQKEGSSRGNFVELSLFSPSRDGSPPGSPPQLGWPMHPTSQFRGM